MLLAVSERVGMSTCITRILAALVLCISIKGHAQAQGRDEARTCWWNYASCATESYGDQNWRSVCYADFSNCLRQKQLPECPAGGKVSDCSTYLKNCREPADADVALMQQCDEDTDACLHAHGC